MIYYEKIYRCKCILAGCNEGIQGCFVKYIDTECLKVIYCLNQDRPMIDYCNIKNSKYIDKATTEELLEI